MRQFLHIFAYFHVKITVFMKKHLFPFLLCSSLFCVLMLADSCTSNNEVNLYGDPTTGICDSTNIKFKTFISPLITSQCATSACHSASRQAAGVNLSDYTTIKGYIASSKTVFLGSIKHLAGYSKMPQSGAKLSACDIANIERWINAGMLNN